MARYKCILFDLFDTLIDFDRQRLPWIQVGDRLVWTAGSPVFDELRRRGLDCSQEQFMEASEYAYFRIEAMRRAEHREYPSSLRFGTLLQRLGLAQPDPGLVEELVNIHMTHMIESLIYPAERVEAVIDLGQRYRIGLVSNFDHGPTAHRALERGGYEGVMEVKVISDEIGWRKPHRRIFEFALDRLQLRPEEALFVGDNYACDVLGASAVGMDTAWYRRDKSDVIPGDRLPAHTLKHFSDLRSLLLR